MGALGGGKAGGLMGAAKMFMAQQSATGLGAAALKYGGTNRQKMLMQANAVRSQQLAQAQAQRPAPSPYQGGWQPQPQLQPAMPQMLMQSR